MSQSELETWGEALESGRPEGPELELAARLRKGRQATPAMPAHLRADLRQRLIEHYNPEAEIIGRVRTARPKAKPMPAKQRLQLRRQLLANYGQPENNQHTRGKRLSGWQLRLAMSFIVVALLWSTGTLDAAAQIIEEIRNRIFVVKGPEIAATPPAATLDPKTQGEIHRQLTAIARAKTAGSSARAELALIQEDLPFKILEPRYLPGKATLETVRRQDSDFSGPGIELRYTFTDKSGAISILQNMPAQPINIQINQAQVVRELAIHGHPAVLYNPGGPPGQKRLILQWTDGTIWFEISSNLEPDEIIKVAESLKP